MQAIRTITWVVVTIVLVGFVAINWTPVPINFWPLADGKYFGFTWPVGFIALLAFLLGMLPMWLLHKTAAWRLRRRIGTLENSVRAASVSLP
ncbi:MAG: LapA family protein, partial [Pseudomonadota bacterium]|nr:LapA family protein [Pseudomonadota bacterium]